MTCGATILSSLACSSRSTAARSFGSPSRTGLLWALECLAWKRKTSRRVIGILAQLSRPKIDDNWTNKPDASLQSIFRSWMPQTAASCGAEGEDAGDAHQALPGCRLGDLHRADQTGLPDRPLQLQAPLAQRCLRGRAGRHTKEMYDSPERPWTSLISWPSHDETTLGDLVESLQGMPEEDQIKVWGLIDEWSRNAGESAKAALRKRIRRFAFTRRPPQPEASGSDPRPCP